MSKKDKLYKILNNASFKHGVLRTVIAILGLNLGMAMYSLGLFENSTDLLCWLPMILFITTCGVAGLLSNIKDKTDDTKTNSKNK